MLPRDVLKSYLREMPRGHIFDLTYKLFADMFPPGEPAASSRPLPEKPRWPTNSTT